MAAVDGGKNNKRNKNAASVIEPLWNQTIEIDYRDIAAKSINSSLASLYPLRKPDDQAQAASYSKAEFIEELNKLPPNTALIYLVPEYYFSDNYKRLRTTLMAQIFSAPSKPIVGNSLPKPDYRSIISYESTDVGTGNSDSINLWTENSAERYFAELKVGLEKTAKILIYDIKGKGSTCSTKSTLTTESLIDRRRTKLKGTLLGVSNNLTVIRTGNGLIYSSKNPNQNSVTDC